MSGFMDKSCLSAPAVTAAPSGSNLWPKLPPYNKANGVLQGQDPGFLAPGQMAHHAAIGRAPFVGQVSTKIDPVTCLAIRAPHLTTIEFRLNAFCLCANFGVSANDFLSRTSISVAPHIAGAQQLFFGRTCYPQEAAQLITRLVQ